MMEGMDPRHLGMMGKKSMELHNYPDALRLFSMGLARLESLKLPRQFAAPFLMDRAECYWQLGEVDMALHEMDNALWHGLPRDADFAEGESLKWSNHGFFLLEEHQFAMAEKCAKFALYFRTSPRTRAQAFLCQVIARYEMGKITGETKETKEIKKLDPNLAKLHAHERKDSAIRNMQNQNYQWAIKSFIFALLLHPDDGSKMKFKRSVESHLANAYFKIKQYKKAVDVGKESYKSNPNFRSKEEAERWKKRGNDLSKEPNLVDQAIACYSLALNFTPAVERELKATIFSNRSLMYNKQGKADQALRDAQNSVENNPRWPKAYYRLGSCLFVQRKYREAMEKFSESLSLLLHDASRSDHQVDTLSQLLSVALELPDGTSTIQYEIPKTYIQTVLDKAVGDEDWATLHLLFLGGGGPKQFEKGLGGLADGCDASKVPLTEVISCDFPNLAKFVSILLDHKARDSPKKRGKTARELAIDLNKFDVASVLMDRNTTSGPGEQLKRKFKENAKKALEEGDNSKAIKLYELFLAQVGNTMEEQRETLQTLCKLYFQEKAFEECLRSGRKLKAAYPKEHKNERCALHWKSWGNELHEERKYDLMVKYYTLALEFTPISNIELMASLLSNRCLARYNLEKFEEALEDADQCTKIKPKWFRGYSRKGTCLLRLKKTKEALQAFCKGYTHAVSDKEEQITAKDVISTAMIIEGGESQITCTLSSHVLQFLVKDASEKKDWNELRFLYLGSAPNRSSRGLASECDASYVPLDLLIESNVEDVHSLVKVLLQRNAFADGLRGCARPPLLAAMEMMNFPLAATLLRNNADSACVVGHGIFMNREGQPKQWLQLGHKAIDANDSKKAVMLLNMSLYLSDSNKDKTITVQTYHALAEAYFIGSEHERCIEAGKECFKLQPVKLEEEAKRWGKRAEQTLHLSNYNLFIDYLNLALKYTPADSKEIFSLLLCQRSEAFQQLNNFKSGLEDAVNASKMCPEMSEVYVHQYKCFQALKRKKEAMHAANECLKRTTDENFIYSLLCDALATAASLKEGTSAITAPVPSKLLERLVSEVIKKKDWHKLRILYLGGGGPGSQPTGDGGMATGISASSVPLGEIIRSNVPERLILVSVLLKHGASANAIEESDAIPLVEAMRLLNLPLVEKLMQNGANPCVTSKGEPIIHQELRSILQKNQKHGTFEFLKAMLRSTLPEVQSVQDEDGNTLYHIACIGKNTSKKCDAIRILREANINPNLRNKRNEYAIQKVPSKRDPRWKMLDTALQHYKSSSSVSATREENSEKVSDEEHDKELQWADVKEEYVSGGDEEKPTTEAKNTPQNVNVLKIDHKQLQRKERRETIVSLIDAITPLSTFVQNAFDTNEEHDDVEIFNESSGSPRAAESNNDMVIKDETVDDDRYADENDILGDSDTETEIDSKSRVEDLPWEVDCTDRFWKIMRNRKVGFSTRKRIIDKIRMLANGRWSKTLCKRLEGEAKRKDIELYESKLTKGQRIIWEKTIAFSGRCSENPELRLDKKNPEGRIYSDIIRVWDIVLDHDKLQRSIDLIVKSHDRGMDCIVKRKLKGMPVKSGGNSALTSECLPNKYAEIGDLEQKGNSQAKKSAPKKSTIADNLPQIFFPPASANEQEYHILKFYSFSTALVKTVLESDISSKIDFPFKITELEHAIVNLRPDPPMPIILLGRSGTGKTTCCLYRLWDRFQSYWERAETAGPYIPRFLPPPLKTSQCSDDDETLQSSIGQDINQAERSPKQASASPECQQPNASSHSASAPASRNDHQDQVMQSNSCPPKAQNQPEENDQEEKQPEMYEHLHQIFITKNNVLCSEVEKNFKELCHACPAAQHRIPFEDQSLPAKMQDVAAEAWPLFFNSRDWLLMLDASLPGKTFFNRAEDGSLLRKIDGWGEEDSHLQFIPATESDDESDHEEEDEGAVGTQHGSEETKQKGKETSINKDRDPRREITYPVFQFELWPKMKKNSKEKVDYHPTLVWTEIRSFIKGSAEALLSENGELSLEDYESLGKKKAPNFSADRKVVYDLYRVYQRERSSKRMFDEADLVYNIHKRLQLITAPEWSVHQIYVDETQDFTQAELSLLIRCCRSPNELFFTGDTAQSIMRGISFRFNDLKSLFHHARKAAGITDDQNNFITVPKKLYQLTHNYRSHAGILRLASSVVDLLLTYFPDSFDRLQKDKGLFEGPRPVLLESCSPTDLAMILQGNQRQSSRIEFGAHQVVLVASNEAREALPDELSQGLVMTIYEAKGLEFDDVLIYNFFKDSQATKEWRVVASFMKDEGFADLSSSIGLVEVTENSATVQSSRPLKFDPDKHKVLNSELKYLYTAITRARVNVWFFDEDKESRAPMFEFFQKRDLVKVVSMGDNNAGSGELASMCATKSTSDEWRKGGLRFYKRSLWKLAIQCFEFAGDDTWVKKSQAQQQAAEAIKLRFTNRQQMKDEFLRSGESFLKCSMFDEAEICLNNAREWALLARLYEKTGKLQDAARLFKKERLHKEASRCYEAQNNYAEAIEVFCRAGIFEEALSALERYNILASSGDLEGKQGIIPPRSTRTVERLRHQLADQHFKRGETIKMEEVLQYLPSTTDRITFLKKRGCIIEAARALDDDGRRDEAARLLKDAGKFEDAERYSTDPKFAADCLISLFRTTTRSEDSSAILEKAFERYQLCSNLNGQAEALLLLGRLSRDSKKLQEAGRLFDKSKNPCGEVESVMQLLETTNFAPPKSFQQWMAVRALERVLGLITTLHTPNKKLTLAEETEITRCEEHFGLFKTDTANEKRYFCKSGGRFSLVYPKIIENDTSNTEATINTLDAHKEIRRFLLSVCAKLVKMTHVMLEKTVAKNTLCTNKGMGTTCSDSTCENQHADSIDLFNNRFLALFHFIYLESVVESFRSEMASRKEEQETLPLTLEEFREFRTCQRFYDFLFPSSGYREYHLSLANIRHLNRTKLVTKRIFQFANVSWKENSEELRRSDTNNFLKVSFYLQLINSSQSMVKWICEEEKTFQRKTRTLKLRPTNDLLAKNGMIGPDENGRFESYLQWWEDGKKRLYVYGDVGNAAHIIIRRFLTLTAKRSQMIYPSIANTVMILEHQLTACLALYSRLSTENRYPVCLPASYLTMVRFWDNCRPGADKGTFTLYQAVEESYAQEANKIKLFKVVRSLLDYMVRLTCGEVADSFDVLGDALDSEESPSYCDSGEAERSLVLFLTMMCNCGKGISIHLEEVMLRKILRIKSNHRLTSCINSVLDKIQGVQGPRDVVMILKMFLQSRAEQLYDLRWYNGKFWHDGACNPTSYPDTFHTDLTHLREGLQQDPDQEKTSKDTETVNTTGADAIEEGMDVEYTEEELKEKENVRRDMNATTIQRWYKRIKSLKKKQAQAAVVPAKTLHRLESTQEQINSESDVLDKYFSQFRVDVSACGICGINFKASAEDTLYMNNEDNEGTSEPTGESTDIETENAEIHGNSPAHLEKEKAFNHYKDLYCSKVHPLYTRQKQLIKVLEDHSLSVKVQLDMDRLEASLSAVKSEMQNIETTLNWEKVSPLQNAIKGFKITLQKTERVVEQAKQESIAAENEDSEPEEEGEELHEEDKEEEHDFGPIQEIPHGSKKNGGKSKRRRKQHRK